VSLPLASQPTPREQSGGSVPLPGVVPPVIAWLSAAQLLTDKVHDFIMEMEIETMSDLGFFFTESNPPTEPCILRAWKVAKDMPHNGHIALVEMLQALRPKPLPPLPMPKQNSRNTKVKPPTVCKVMTMTQDTKNRLAMAEQAVALSWSWAPNYGLAKNLPPSDEVQLRRRNACIMRIGKFEPRAVRAAVLMWMKWVQYLQLQALRPMDITITDTWVIEDFLDQVSKTATGPRSAYDKLLWLQKHLMAPVFMDSIPKPLRGANAEHVSPEQQAVVLEIPMLTAIELHIHDFRGKSDWRLGALLGCWLMCLGCIRYQHLQRSAPVQLTEHWVMFAAFRGKSKEQGSRTGFIWYCPRQGILDTDIGKVVWEHWQSLQNSEACFLCFDSKTHYPLELSKFQDVIREVLLPLLTDGEQAASLTSYSFRRFLPTFNAAREAPWTDRMAAGGWKENPDGKQEKTSLMPARYSALRRQEELKVKLMAPLILRSVQVHESPSWTTLKLWLNANPEIVTGASKKVDEIIATPHQIEKSGSSMCKLPWVMGKAPFKLSSTVLAKLRAHSAKQVVSSIPAPLPGLPPEAYELSPSDKATLDQILWVASQRSAGLLHVRSDQCDRTPRCLLKKGDKGQLKGQIIQARGLDAVREQGRFLCPQCLTILGRAVVTALKMTLPGYYFPTTAVA
jgi:hypothetical protein